MLGKSLVAGTVLTLLAGGVVYYGTDVGDIVSVKSSTDSSKLVSAEGVSKAESSAKDTGAYIVKTETDVETESQDVSDIPSLKTANGELISPKAITSEAKIEKKAEVTADVNESVSTEPSTRKWIDKYLKSEAEPENTDEVATELEMHTDAKMDSEIAAMEAEIAEILAQEEANDKEMAAMMAELKETERLETLEVEIKGEADAKDFETRAKNIENIWISKDEVDEDEATVDSKTLREILKKNHMHEDKVAENTISTSPENDVIDLGDSKIIILKTENVEGLESAKNKERKIRIKVRKDGETIYCDENHLKENVYNFPGMDKHHDHSAHEHPEHPQIDHAEKDDIKSDVTEAEDVSANVSDTVSIIMAQAEKISMSELRDRAYLDLVSYALDNDDMTTAKIAMSKIEQVELRDTARNRMAVDYAKNGNAGKAFAILEDIEVDALRDVMRLQVIEALIAPEAPTPQDMQ